MMKTRRKHILGDNLGLLLDAICNTFGAVLLIAILIAVLLNTSAQNLLPTDEQIEQIKTLRTLEDEQITLEAKKRELELILNASEAFPGSAKIESTQTLELIMEIQVIREKISGYEKTLAELKENRKQKRAAERDLAGKELTLMEQLDELQRELELEIKSRTKVAELPVLKVDSKNQVAILIRYDRLYLPHTYSDGTRGPINTEHMMIVKSRDDSGKPITEARAKPNAGIDLTAINCTRKIKSMMRNFNPQKESIIVLSGTGSFESYNTVVAVLTEMNFNFFPWPIGDQGVWDRGGSGTQTQ